MQSFMHWIKRNERWLAVVGGFFLVLIIWLVYDRIHYPDTTPEMMADAEAHALATVGKIPPHSFLYDGCTLIPEQFLGYDLNTACIPHDIAYWAGGTEAERIAADRALRDTMRAHGNILVSGFGWISYTAVYLFGDTIVARALGRNWGHGFNE